MTYSKMFSLVACSVLLSGTVAAAAIPGPQRMVAPEMFGFEEIAEGIYAPPEMPRIRREEALRALDDAARTVDRFFGAPFPRPRIVLCPGTSCDGAFGLQKARGVAYGADMIRLNEKGINRTIATHEFSHVALKARVGRWRTFFGAVPSWFDEGLAVMISHDERLTGIYPEPALKQIAATGDWRTFGDSMKRIGWKTFYGGSAQLVKRICFRAGSSGIVAMLDRIGAGEAFGDVLYDARNDGGENRCRMVN